MNHVTHPLSSAVSAFFHWKSANFAISEIRYRLHIDTWFLVLLTYLESLKIYLINMVAILMMSAKMATLGLLKIKVCWNKGYEVKSYVHDVTNQFLLRDSNCIVDMVMIPKSGNSSIYIREVIITSMLYGFDQKKTLFLMGGLGWSSIIWDWHQIWPWNFVPMWQKA